MKKILMQILAIIVVSMTIHCKKTSDVELGSVFSDDRYYVFTRTSLNLRAEPNKTSPSLGQLPRGTELKVLERTNVQEIADGMKGFWWKVEGDGKTGYVFSGYISRYMPSKNECHTIDGYLAGVFGELNKDNKNVKNYKRESNQYCETDSNGVNMDMEKCQASESYTLDKGIQVSIKSGHEWMEEEIFFPGMTEDEGFLLLRDCCKEDTKLFNYQQYRAMLDKGTPIPEFQETFYRGCVVKKKEGGLILGGSGGL